MAKIIERPRIELQVLLALTEEECRALDALVGYGDDAFIKAFYELLGKAYMEKHEAGLRLLFKSIREQMPCALAKVDDARKVFNGTHEIKPSQSAR